MVEWLPRVMSSSSSRTFTMCQISQLDSMLFRHSITSHCVHKHRHGSNKWNANVKQILEMVGDSKKKKKDLTLNTTDEVKKSCARGCSRISFISAMKKKKKKCSVFNFCQTKAVDWDFNDFRKTFLLLVFFFFFGLFSYDLTLLVKM